MANPESDPTVIADGSQQLVDLLKAGKMVAAVLARSDRTKRCSVAWSGSDSDGFITFEIQVVAAAYHELGDLFTKAWNLIADSEEYAPQAPSVAVAYDETPTGGQKRASLAAFQVRWNRKLDARGL